MRDLTHRKVERRAGLAQGSAKYHFGSLGGLVEAVLERMVAIELDNVMTVPSGVLAEADATGHVPEAVWRQARAVCAGILARPALLRARFELYLHAIGRPELQKIIRRGRERFVARTAAALTADRAGATVTDVDQGAADPAVARAASGARMVLALVDGMVLHHLSAPDDPGTAPAGPDGVPPPPGPGTLDRMSLHLVASAVVARQLPELRPEAYD